VRTLTFWLQPDFVLRVVNRFQKVAGFDSSVALASSALTAVIPLAIVAGAAASPLGAKDTAARIIARYGLTGGGADAVRGIFASPSGTSTSLGVAGFLFLMVAVLSFTRAVQRLFEQTWELTPLSVRNTVNGLVWAGGLCSTSRSAA
jgi:membrane protein